MAETRTHWKDDEWQLVCAELYKVKPMECRSSTMIGISSSDMIAAMHKALPESRWRLSMNMTKTRPKLIEHMTIFLQVQRAIKVNEDQQRQEAEQQEQDIIKEALAPLAKMLAELLFEHLKPLLDGHLAHRSLNSYSGEVVVSHHRESPTARQHKVKVGVIGLLPIQTESLKTQFPQLDFKFVEKGGNSDEVRGLTNMDAIFGLTQKMNHNAEYVLKKTPAWDRYHRVAGKGTTAVKRSIISWLNP